MVNYWDKYTETHGQQNDTYTETHGQQNVKISFLFCNFLYVRPSETKTSRYKKNWARYDQKS